MVAVDTHRLECLPRSPRALPLSLHKTRANPRWRFEPAGVSTLPLAGRDYLDVSRKCSTRNETRLLRPRFAGVAAPSLACALTCNSILRRDCPFTEAPTRDQGFIRVSALSVVALGPSTSPHSRHAWIRPIANYHRQCRAMLRRTTVRDETDHAHHLALPIDVLQLLPQVMAVAPQTSVEVAQTHLEAHDHNLTEAGPHSDPVHLVLVHHGETTLGVAKFEN